MSWPQSQHQINQPFQVNFNVCWSVKPAEALPTYCDLIDLYTEFGSDDHIWCAEISKHFPSISVKCPGCVVDTVSRIVAPATTISINIRTVKLTGSPLCSYCQHVWKPRIRTSRSEGSEY